MRRELQIALALAFSSGAISLQNLTRYMRRIEIDTQTIALNRTQVGFAHANDTFGWRFYPRFQTPQVESNLKVAFRDLLWGGPNKDAMLKQHRLEPGMRECMAVVIMPSFISHMRFDVRSNWFKLTEQDRTRANLQESMQMSRRIREMQTAAECCMAESHLYRDGEVDRLLRRVEQLSKELPIQTMHSSVPNENTLGGFEIFSSGVTDLAPELHDFYGEPGIKAGETSHLFLIGDHFSINGTQVIVGNRSLAPDKVKLLSRQVIEIEVPANVRATQNKTVDVHVATPYGVTGHLEVPYQPAPASTGAGGTTDAMKEHEAAKHAVGFSWNAARVSAEAKITYETGGSTRVLEIKDLVASNLGIRYSGSFQNPPRDAYSIKWV